VNEPLFWKGGGGAATSDLNGQFWIDEGIKHSMAQHYDLKDSTRWKLYL